ncbi:unnamed protein product [Closterium sp. NIES-53]
MGGSNERNGDGGKARTSTTSSSLSEVGEQNEGMEREENREEFEISGDGASNEEADEQEEGEGKWEGEEEGEINQDGEEGNVFDHSFGLLVSPISLRQHPHLGGGNQELKLLSSFGESGVHPSSPFPPPPSPFPPPPSPSFQNTPSCQGILPASAYVNAPIWDSDAGVSELKLLSELQRKVESNESIPQGLEDFMLKERWLIWMPRFGLGNSLRAYTSAFIFALLSGRRLLRWKGGNHKQVRASQSLGCRVLGGWAGELPEGIHFGLHLRLLSSRMLLTWKGGNHKQVRVS